jgi:hypothetical protein
MTHRTELASLGRRHFEVDADPGDPNEAKQDAPKENASSGHELILVWL